MKWPDQSPVPAAAVRHLLESVNTSEFVQRFNITMAQLTKWRAEGVPPGPYSGLVRAFSRDNAIALTAAGAVGERCVLCEATADMEFAGTPLCRYCESHAQHAGERIGFRFASGQMDHRSWIGVGSPTSFEFPFAAKLKRQSGTWFTKPDPEVGHPEFDDAVRIDTEDYEALFDTFQHPRRRVLAQGIAQAAELQINVDGVFAIYPFNRPIHHERLVLSLLLLAWSLAHETAPHLVDV